MNKKTDFSVLSLLGVLLVVGLCAVSTIQSPQPIERNYYGEYQLGLIPNSPELPATRADVIIAQSETKEMIESPFGYVYLRDR